MAKHKSHDSHEDVTPTPTKEAEDKNEVVSEKAGGAPAIGYLVIVGIIFLVLIGAGVRSFRAWWNEPAIPANTSAAGTAVAQQPQDPRKHQCYIPCDIDVEWDHSRLEGPGAKLEIDVPLKGGGYHKFVFGADEQIDFTKDKAPDGSLFKTWKGYHHFATPGKSGLLMTVFEVDR